MRVAIYVQTLLSLVPAFLFAWDGTLGPNEENLIDTISANLSLTGCALAFSALIQAATFGLSTYHALIVLNLGWLVNSSALIVCIFPIIHWRSQKSIQHWMVRLWPSKVKQIPAYLLVVIHPCATAALGIWVWAKIRVFGNSPQCTSAIRMTILFHNFRVLSAPLRITSLLIYMIVAIPGAHTLIFASLSAKCSYYLGQLTFKVPYHRFAFNVALKLKTWFLITVLIQGLICVLVIANTELMIHRNKWLVSIGESHWTFGQTLAMILVAYPMIGTATALRPTIQRRVWGRRVVLRMEWLLRSLVRKSGKDLKTCRKKMCQIEEAHQCCEQSIGLCPQNNPRTPIILTLDAVRFAFEAANSALMACDAIVESSRSSSGAAQAISSDAVNSIRELRDDGFRIICTVRNEALMVNSLRFPEFDNNMIGFSAMQTIFDTVKSALDTAEAAIGTAVRILNDPSLIVISPRPVFFDSLHSMAY